jgi:very-short-patch-repair endonuclease
MNEADWQIADLAANQFGVIAREQAAVVGLSDYAMTRRVMSGRWEELFPGVYRLAGTPRVGRQRAMAAVLWAGPKSAISHTTAGRLLRLDAVHRREMHLTVPRSSGVRTSQLVVHHASSLPASDLVVVDGIRCTSATRTVIDCAALLGDEALETAFEHARRMGLTSAAALSRRAEELCGRGRPGSTRIRGLIALQEAGARPLESRLEVRMARLLRRSGLPSPERQHPVGRYRLDFAWPARLVACECDGFEHHGHRLAWKRDRARVAALEAAGWRVVHVTWDDVTHRPDRTVDRINLALRSGERAA